MDLKFSVLFCHIYITSEYILCLTLGLILCKSEFSSDIFVHSLGASYCVSSLVMNLFKFSEIS